MTTEVISPVYNEKLIHLMKTYGLTEADATKAVLWGENIIDKNLVLHNRTQHCGCRQCRDKCSICWPKGSSIN